MLTAQDLDRRIRQMHLALGDVRTPDLSDNIEIESGPTENGGWYVDVDFGDGLSDVELHDRAEHLVDNVARMKDHLKAWCTQNRVNFAGDTLINTVQNVAIVHDLWNTHKHAVLNRPRSGHRPKVVNLMMGMRLSTGIGPGSVAVTLDPITGAPTTITTGGGSAEIVLDGDIVDEHGTKLGNFLQICQEAVEHWERALAAAGVSVPAR